MVTDFGYDANGNPQSLTRTTPTSEVVTESATYNARGLLSTATDARGKTTSHDYNTHGDLISETSPQLGHQLRHRSRDRPPRLGD